MQPQRPQHTKGPWQAQPSYAERGKFAGHRAVYAVHGGPIAYLGKGPHDHINDGNARLIAAAPELLIALQDLVDMVNGNRVNDIVVRNAEAVLAKAAPALMGA